MLRFKQATSALVLLVIASLVLTACDPPAAAPPAAAGAMTFKAKDPTTYIIAVAGDPETLDPALDYELTGIGLILNLYDTLIYFNKSAPDSFVPQLALEVPSVENGGIAADGRTYTFKIRTGVHFHNGDELTPQDVAYTFQRGLLQGGSASPQWLLAEPLLGVTDVAELVDASGALVDDPAALVAVDADKLKAVCQQVIDAIVADPTAGTVAFKLQRPWAPFVATLSSGLGAITDQRWLIANGAWDGSCDTWQKYYGKTSEQLNSTKIGAGENGTGPYILDHWTPSEEYVLKANENYWRTEPAWPGGPVGAPTLKTIVVKYVEEFSTRFAMLQAGDVDVIWLSSSQDYPQMDPLVGDVCDHTAKCQRNNSPNQPLRVHKGLPSVDRGDIFLNWQVNTEGGNTFIGSGVLDGNGIPPDFFSNVHLRKAFAYCFDWETYITEVQQGEAVQSYNVMLPGMLGYDEQSPHYSYDPAQCQTEFAAAAPELQAKYGADINTVGFRFSMAYPTGCNQCQTVGQILQQNVVAINDKFVIELTALPWPNFLQNQRARNFPVFFSGWIEDIHDPHNWVVGYTTGLYGRSQGLPDDLMAQFADIVDRGVSETDPARRAEIYKEFNQLFYEQVPTILLSVQLGRRYEQRWVKGWYHNPIMPIDYYYSMAKE